MKLQYEVFSDIGGRELNEDSANIKTEGTAFLAAVADGLGGHEKGEVASGLFVNTMMNSVSLASGDYQEELHRAMLKVQEELLALQKKEKESNSMKTTGVVLCGDRNYAYLAHVGDSRGYIFYKHRKPVRTCDHSVSQMLALAGEIKEKQIRFHEDRNKLLKVFGSNWVKDACDFLPPIALSKVKAFLLCTDGFWELINEKQMKQCLRKSKTAKEWMERMLVIVRNSGKNILMDNYTAITIFIE